MIYPKIHSVEAVASHLLIIEFDNKQKKQYDTTPLFEKEAFAPLKNIALFKAVQVEKGGYAVYWNSDIDISEYELWCHGKEIS
jgi:hypothetical protein